MVVERFDITEQATPEGPYVVAVHGALNLFTAPDAKVVLERVIDDGCSRLVVDLSETTFLDSSGMAVLMTARKRMARNPDGRVVVVCGDKNLMSIFAITGLPQVLEFVPSRQAALDALADGDASP